MFDDASKGRAQNHGVHSLVDRMISQYTPLGWYTSASHLLTLEEENLSGNFEDFRLTWILYGGLLFQMSKSGGWENPMKVRN